MKIDKDKPLPDHTSLDYDECCVLLILKELFPERYSVLEIADMPDLQGLDVGVEVTIADEKDHLEALNNWVKAYNCEDEKQRERYIERMKQLGVTYTGGVQSWPGKTPSFKSVKEAVDNKISKLKTGNYKCFSSYELFILTDEWMTESILNQAQQYFADNNVYAWFKRIYVLEKGYKLFIFEASNKDQIIIDKSEQSERNIRARRMVEMAEE